MGKVRKTKLEKSKPREKTCRNVKIPSHMETLLPLLNRVLAQGIGSNKAIIKRLDAAKKQKKQAAKKKVAP
jgi:hypothetical protein